MRFSKILATLFGIFLLVSPSLFAGKIFPYSFISEELPNGLKLITIPTEFPNIVSVFIVVGTGSRNEVEPGKSGFAHLFEHLMFRGTPEFSPEKYQGTLRDAGAASNAFTTDDFTAFHTTFSKEDLPKILSMEADRFQHLSYEPEAFKTESLAVLGEYNKNSANPVSKLGETVRSTAFGTHTYRHTTMGFLADIQAMPGAFEYSREFFDRYYRPENTTIIVAGDVTAKQVRSLVDERWGTWKRGNFKAQIPAEPPQNGARTAHVTWPTSTLPWVSVSFRAPAYSDENMEGLALDAIARLGFGNTSPLYQKLVISEQKADVLRASLADHVDPELFSVTARVKKQEDVASVERQILDTLASFAATPVDAARLVTLKQRLRYQVALSLNNSEAVAELAARYVGLRKTPDNMNRESENYDRLTPEDLQKAAKKFLIEKSRTIVTLSSDGGSK